MRSVYVILGLLVAILVVYILLLPATTETGTTTTSSTESLDPRTRHPGVPHSNLRDITSEYVDEAERQVAVLDNAPVQDSVFFPAPAITERVQSTQWEHLQEQQAHFDVEYRPKYKFELVRPRTDTVAAYQQAMRDQVYLVRNQLYKMFGHVSREIDLTHTEFNSPFRAVLDTNELSMANWRAPHIQAHLLRAQQYKISDDAFDAFARMMYGYGLVVTPEGGAKHGGAVRQTNYTTVTSFGNRQFLTVHNDGLSTERRKPGVPLSMYTPAQVTRLARDYVQRTYIALLDKHKYEIKDMDAAVFETKQDTILETGHELLDDYIIRKPTRQQLDAFCVEVEESMRETLHDILLTNGVDILRYQ